MKLRSALLPLLAANAVAAPNLVGALLAPGEPTAPGQRTECPCGSTPSNVQLPSREESAKRMAEAVLPSCANMDFSNCTRDDGYVWYFCRRNSSQPLACSKWTHPVTVWTCPGATWYKCYGSWSNSNTACTPCTGATPSNLPAGCSPPFPGNWQQCN